MLGRIGRPKSPSIVDLIMCTLRNFALIDFVVGRTLFRWEATTREVFMHPESTTAGFSTFDYGIFFVVVAQAVLLHICALSFPV